MRFSERTVRSGMVPASGLLLLLGMVGSLVPFYAGRAFDFKQAMISDLASRVGNPHGFFLADMAIVAWAAMLLPVVWWWFCGLRKIHRKTAAVGALVFAAGLAGSLGLGVTGFQADVNSAVHIYLAYATFVALSAGSLLLMVLAAGCVDTHRLSLWLGTTLQAGVLAFLLYLVWSQLHDEVVFFTDTDLLRSIALCEWLLGVVNVAYVWWLSRVVAAMQHR